jgi:DNA-binding transcriptional regulator YdaS (Cro superfamily)
MKNIELAVKIVGNSSKLARKIGVSRALISYWISGNRKVSNPVHAIKIEKATNGIIRKEDLIRDFDFDEIC